MGKLNIRGYAEKEVQCDAVELMVQFHIHAKTVSKAMKIVMEQSEEFLALMKDAGVDINQIYIDDNSVEQEYEEGVLDVQAFREFKIRMAFDMAFINYVMDLIVEKGFDVTFDCEYHIAKAVSLHEELLKEALADSKKKAEAIACAMEQKIVGIDHIEHSRYGSGVYDFWGERETCHFLGEGHRPERLSNGLKAPLSKESENIEVVWIIK